MTAYLVFYARGARIGSVPSTPENLSAAHKLMHLTLIQRDVSGTEHYSVTPR